MEIHDYIPYNANFSNPKDPAVLRLFSEMHESCSGLQTNGITLKKFLSGSAFFVIPLNSNLQDCGSLGLIHEGTTTLKLQFDKPFPKAVTLIVIGEFDQLLFIDRNRIVVSDGTV